MSKTIVIDMSDKAGDVYDMLLTGDDNDILLKVEKLVKDEISDWFQEHVVDGIQVWPEKVEG